MTDNLYFRELLGKYIKEQRVLLRKTQPEVCKHLGFSCQFYGKIEKGLAPCPKRSLKLLVKILKLNRVELKRIYRCAADNEVTGLFRR